MYYDDNNATREGSIRPQRTRILDLGGYTAEVRAGLIVGPGKFGGLAPHAVRDYNSDFHDDAFGDCHTFGAYYWQVGHRFYQEDTFGTVYEIDREGYDYERDAYNAFCDREEALEIAQAELDDAEAEESGRCDSCEAAMINGIRCHETGCPRFARLTILRSHVAGLEAG